MASSPRTRSISASPHIDAAVEAETLAGVDASLGFLAAALNDRDPKSHLRGPMIQPAFRVRAT